MYSLDFVHYIPIICRLLGWVLEKFRGRKSSLFLGCLLFNGDGMEEMIHVNEHTEKKYSLTKYEPLQPWLHVRKTQEV